jgi:hypothetical protein
MLKHVGKMKHNGAKVAVIYRTLPGDAFGALVVGTASLSETQHNALMNELESALGQQANEFGDHISNRYFQDGANILESLHLQGKLRRVETTEVVMMPTSTDEVMLSELNEIIAEQKGVTLDDLSIKSDMPHLQRKTNVQEIPVKDHTGNHPRVTEKQKEYPPILSESPSGTKEPEVVSVGDLKNEISKLLLEAQRLQKLADSMEPAKKKTSAKAKQKNTESEHN